MKLFRKISIILAIALVLSVALSINIFATEVEVSGEAISEVSTAPSKLDMNMSGADMSMGERASYALQGTVTGMLMIFLVLGLLAGVVSLSKVVLYDIPNKKKAAREAASVPVAAEISATEETDEAIVAEDDTQLAAVITAAIAAMLDSEQYSNEFKSGFRVVSFKKVNTNGAWNKK